VRERLWNDVISSQLYVLFSDEWRQKIEGNRLQTQTHLGNGLDNEIAEYTGPCYVWYIVEDTGFGACRRYPSLLC